MNNVLEGWANIDRKEVTPIEDPLQPASWKRYPANDLHLGSQAEGGEALNLRGSKFHHTV